MNKKLEFGPVLAGTDSSFSTLNADIHGSEFLHRERMRPACMSVAKTRLIFPRRRSSLLFVQMGRKYRPSGTGNRRSGIEIGLKGIDF